MKIGFVGLGIMGKHMSKNLIKSGYDIIVYDINKSAMIELQKFGAKGADSLQEIALCDIIITMLPDSPQVKDVMLSPGGIMEYIQPPSTVIDMSSIDPNVTKEIAAKLIKKNVQMIDAPVSGGEPKAENGTLAIMCGGNEEVFNNIKEILLCMGSTAVLVGDIGSGNVAKLANQIMVACNIAGMSEALSFADKMSVSREKVFEAVKSGLAQSTVLDVKAPMILDNNFDPGFRIELHIKDLTNLWNAAQKANFNSPFTKLTLEIFREVGEMGFLKSDHGAMIKYYTKDA